jgi:hypothetical protein
VPTSFESPINEANPWKSGFGLYPHLILEEVRQLAVLRWKLADALPRRFRSAKKVGATNNDRRAWPPDPGLPSSKLDEQHDHPSAINEQISCCHQA